MTAPQTASGTPAKIQSLISDCPGCILAADRRENTGMNYICIANHEGANS